MGLFEPRNYERTAMQLRELFGADDRITGMIPDTYGDPSEAQRYEGRRVSMSDILRPFRELGREIGHAPRGDWQSMLGADDRVTGMIPDAYSEANKGRSFGSYRMPKTREIINPVRNAGAEIASLFDREDFVRGIRLAEDNESFLDRQTYLDDGTVGSEEKARAYKAEGTKELLRGTMYGAANVPDAILGLALDEDNILRAPTQAAKRALDYEPTGDEEIDTALRTMHDLGQGVGEAVMTGGSAGLMRKGVLAAANQMPRQMMFRAPEAAKNMLPYSWQNKAHQMPHISEALKENTIGRAVLDATTEGVSEGALMYQLAQEENWGNEDLATLGAMTIGTGLLGSYASSLPRPTWEPVNTKRAPYEAAALERDAYRKYLMDEYAKEYGKPFKTIKQGKEEVRVIYDWPHPAENHRVPQLMTLNGKVIRDEKYRHPLYHLPPQYKDATGKNLPRSPWPHQLRYNGYDGKPKRSQAFEEARAREREREIPELNNAEIEVYPNKAPKKKDIGIAPSDGLILKNELRRVFGKHAQLDRQGDDAFHITLPNGIELNAQTVDDLTADPVQAAAVRGRYDLPSRTRFRLKGSLDHVDAFDLIRLTNLRDEDTLQHEAVRFAMNTVTTPKEKETLRKMFGEREADQVAGVMEAIRQERATQQMHPGPFVNKLLRKMEKLGGQVRSLTENVPTAIAKRDLSYLEGRSPRETLRDYAESFIDGSVWGRDVAPVMRQFVDKHRDEIAETIKKHHSMYYNEAPRITLAHRSPNIFSILPYDNHPLQIDNNIVNKVLLEKHSDSITPENIAQLPQALEQPVMIIKGDWDVYGKTPKEIEKKREERKDTYNFLLDVMDKNNANILVPVGFGYQQNGVTSNRVKSLYGMTSTKDGNTEKRTDIERLLRMVKHNDLVYVDRDKLLSIIRDYAPQEYYDIRDYLDKHLPEHVYTRESYRDYRKRRGMKPELDMQENYFDPINV